MREAAPRRHRLDRVRREREQRSAGSAPPSQTIFGTSGATSTASSHALELGLVADEQRAALEERPQVLLREPGARRAAERAAGCGRCRRSAPPRSRRARAPAPSRRRRAGRPSASRAACAGGARRSAIPASGLLISWATTAASLPERRHLLHEEHALVRLLELRASSPRRGSRACGSSVSSSRAGALELGHHVVPRPREVARSRRRWRPGRARRGRPRPPRRPRARAGGPGGAPGARRGPPRGRASPRPPRGCPRPSGAATRRPARPRAPSESCTSRTPSTRLSGACAWQAAVEQSGALRIGTITARTRDPAAFSVDAHAVGALGPLEGPVRAVADRALLGVLVHERARLVGLRADLDPPRLVEDPDPLDPGLGADRVDDAAHALGVVAQHRVARRAQDDVGVAVGARRARGRSGGGAGRRGSRGPRPRRRAAPRRRGPARDAARGGP